MMLPLRLLPFGTSRSDCPVSLSLSLSLSLFLSLCTLLEWPMHPLGKFKHHVPCSSLLPTWLKRGFPLNLRMHKIAGSRAWFRHPKTGPDARHPAMSASGTQASSTFCSASRGAAKELEPQKPRVQNTPECLPSSPPSNQ